jgi:hypothetical protein
MPQIYTYYLCVTLVNQTTSYLTLNATSNDKDNLFLADTSYSVAPGTQALVVNNALPQTGSSTYNLTENALVNISWGLNNDQNAWTCAASVSGTSEYTVSGYNDSTVTTGNEGYAYYTAFTLTVSSTTTS